MECEKCLFWKKFAEIDATSMEGEEFISTGYCKRYPPQYSAGDSDWPTTDSKEWCGEFKKRK